MIPNLPKFKSLVSNSRENYIQANYQELVELYTDTENCIDALNQMAKDILMLSYNNSINETTIEELTNEVLKYKRICRILSITFVIYIILSIVFIWIL